MGLPKKGEFTQILYAISIWYDLYTKKELLDFAPIYILYLRDIVSANIQIMPASLSHLSPSSQLTRVTS